VPADAKVARDVKTSRLTLVSNTAARPRSWVRCAMLESSVRHRSTSAFRLAEAGPAPIQRWGAGSIRLEELCEGVLRLGKRTLWPL
jgi:hypothetical protein